jgi:hypothetical protein
MLPPILRMEFSPRELMVGSMNELTGCSRASAAVTRDIALVLRCRMTQRRHDAM